MGWGGVARRGVACFTCHNTTQKSVKDTAASYCALCVAAKPLHRLLQARSRGSSRPAFNALPEPHSRGGEVRPLEQCMALPLPALPLTHLCVVNAGSTKSHAEPRGMRAAATLQLVTLASRPNSKQCAQSGPKGRWQGMEKGLHLRGCGKGGLHEWCLVGRRGHDRRIYCRHNRCLGAGGMPTRTVPSRDGYDSDRIILVGAGGLLGARDDEMTITKLPVPLMVRGKF